MGLKNKKDFKGFTPNHQISEKIACEVEEGRIACASAFKLAENLGLSPEEIGRYADALDIRLSKCRIGLFGYGKGVKLVKKLDEVDKAIEEQIERLVNNSRINCADILKIAEQMKTSPVTVGSVCQTNNIKIKNCSLGAF